MSATNFFNTPFFAVVGASSDRSKFGNKVLLWFTSHQLPVTPINPKSTTIESIACVKSVADLEHPSSTALSLIVPPAVTLQVMAQARAAGIKNFWLQPGCENEEVVAYIRDWARSDKSMNAILGGPCILVEGGDALRSCDRSRL